MKKLKSLQRRITVLSILAVALAAMWVFRPAATSTQRSEDLPALFEGFVGAQVAHIALKQDGSLLTGGKVREVKLEARARRDGTTAWVVSSAFDYPAGDEKVARLFSEVSQAKLVAEATRRKEAFEQYVQDGAWIEVELKDADGKRLAAFGVGTSRDNETYLRLDAPEPRVVRVRNFAAYSARATPEAWFEARLFPELEAGNVESLELTQKIEVDGKPSTRRLAFVKKPQEAAKEGEPPPERGWDMRAPEAGPASRPDVEDLARALVGLIFQDVVDRVEGDGDAKYGFASPEIVATATFAPLEPGKPGQKIQLTLGAKDAEAKVWYARRAGAAWVFTVRDDEYGTGRFRSDPSKFKPAPPPSEKPADAPPAPAGDKPPAPPDSGAMGDPDGEPPPAPPAPPAPVEPPAPPAPEQPK